MTNCWPDDTQVLLFKAAFAGPDARAALDAWRSRVDLDRLEPASTRLLPLLRWRLTGERADEPLRTVLQEAAARAADRNAVLLDALCEAMRLLHAHGVDTLVLKGAGLIAAGVMPEAGRRMADADLLVPDTQALAARDILRGAGWRFEGRIDADLVTVRHAVAVRSPSGQPLDLHWHVLPECATPGADSAFWQAAVAVRLRDVETRVLGPADMLLHACVHGLGWSISPPIRWVSDAWLVIDSAGPALDWERLVTQAEQRMLVLPVADALRYLRTTFDAPVPDWVTHRLAQAAVPGWALAEHRVKMRPRTFTRQVMFHWFLHRRLRSSGTWLGDLASMPAYVKRRWPSRTTPAPKARTL
jgi:hypothetical protein